MQRLPRLVIDRVAWRLPITDSTASGLLEILPAPWTNESTLHLESLLVANPLLTIWFALRVRNSDNLSFGSHADLASWLSRDRLIAELHWDDSSDAAPLPADKPTLATWQRLADTATRTLSQPAGKKGSVPVEHTGESRSGHDRACFRRALSSGAKWFGSCCLRPEYLKDGIFVDQLVSRFTELGASILVSDIQPSASGDADNNLRANERANEWSNAQLVAPLLPSLLAQTRRLAQLEDRFATQLEESKLQSLKELAYGASHEINNPLANISGRAQTLLVDETDPERRRKLAAINRQAFRAHDMIADMMLFAKPPKLKPQPVHVAQIIDEVVVGLRDRSIECNVRIEQRLDDEIPEIAADPVQLSVALHSILQNAIQAIQEDGTITISAAGGGVPPHQHAVTVRVQDSGPGISEQTRLHIFDPFFSGREAGRGLGFGLSKAWRIVREHGGRLDVENVANGSGTVFTMRVPSQAG